MRCCLRKCEHVCSNAEDEVESGDESTDEDESGNEDEGLVEEERGTQNEDWGKEHSEEESEEYEEDKKQGENGDIEDRKAWIQRKIGSNQFASYRQVFTLILINSFFVLCTDIVTGI